MRAVSMTVGLIRAAQKAWTKRWAFLLAFLGVFFVTFSVLVVLDLIPETSTAKADEPTVTVTSSPLVSGSAETVADDTVPAAGELPVKIEIPTIKVSATIANPETTDVATLDRYLLKGAVRYPSSAKLGENGNVILFAHSSYLPIVNNLAYKTFDGIQNLKKGDRITVSSLTHTYVYSVDTVMNADAHADAIPLTVSGQKLTLSTCDSFGTKSDRFVVTATLVESHLLGS